MFRAALSLSLLFAVAPLFAGIAPEKERDEARRAMSLAYGRYELLPESLRWPSLTIDGKTYVRARVHSADTWNATLFYDTGVRSVPLSKLPAATQRLLGYDPEHPPAPPVAPAVPAVSTAPAKPASPDGLARKKPRIVWNGDPVARVLAAYGERPRLEADLDLRPEFERLGLSAKNQGISPSCSVFAVTSALEYHLARVDRLKGRLSEEFLHWATLRSLGKTKDRLDIFGGEARLSDGLALIEVTQALRSYGIPLKSDMPERFDPGADTPPEPAQREAWSRCLVGAVVLSGRTRGEQLEQMILALNEGIPVIVGLRWPKPTIEFYTTGKIPDRPAEFSFGHAVVMVGYSCPAGDITRTVFRFRNSYGATWGDKGYGTVSWAYLQENFANGMFLDLR